MRTPTLSFEHGPLIVDECPGLVIHVITNRLIVTARLLNKAIALHRAADGDRMRILRYPLRACYACRAIAPYEPRFTAIPDLQ